MWKSSALHTVRSVNQYYRVTSMDFLMVFALKDCLINVFYTI